ncbi:MAG: hypothetical protein AB8D78_05415 [Akkermansiaceae bacterium]
MKKLILILGLSVFSGIFPVSCVNPDYEYQPISHGGMTYYYSQGVYYRRYGNDYRPCPRPPGLPEHPIVRPPNRPDRPTTLPSIDRPSNRPTTLPANRPMTRPMPRPSARPSMRR